MAQAWERPNNGLWGIGFGTRVNSFMTVPFGRSLTNPRKRGCSRPEVCDCRRLSNFPDSVEKSQKGTLAQVRRRADVGRVSHRRIVSLSLGAETRRGSVWALNSACAFGGLGPVRNRLAFTWMEAPSIGSTRTAECVRTARRPRLSS
jgi:hypothetical protein